ncbi:MAG: phosphatidate cytidylyltransferase [Acidimicrobiales bacterium]|nr:phosphatidate cytidylyltransferase [Acidimicrobiales bacterium]
MDDQPRSRPDDERQTDPSEGVRIIGADEAAEVMEREDIAARRSDDELRYGDRPPAPPDGPRPALRFPLDADADPTRIERPPVEPPPEPVTGPVSLPHWTEPPTGEVPAVLIGGDEPLLADDEDDLDAWSSFATSAPRWRDADDDWGDDDFVGSLADPAEPPMGSLAEDAGPSHEEYYGFEDMDERVTERTGEQLAADEGVRIRVGDDEDWGADPDAVDGGWESDDEWADDDQWEDDGDDAGAYEPVGASGGGDRNMPMAIGIGLGLAAVGVVALILGPAVTTVLVAAVLAVCAFEYFEVLRKVGWESAHLVGLAACVAMPLAVYWRGIGAVALVLFITVVTVLVWYLVGAGGTDPRVLEGSGATLLGVAWIGGLGSAAAGIVLLGDGIALLLIAILGTVAYDVGGLFIGRAMGEKRLTTASPNKTVEGLLGGMVCSFLVPFVLAGIAGIGPWTGFGAGVFLGLGAAVAAPLGDLCQSLLKRDLGVKDMGSLLPGHGGVFDRFDAMLFVLPTVLWLAVTVGNAGLPA